MGYTAGSGANKPKGLLNLSDTSTFTTGDFNIAEGENGGGPNSTVNVDGTSTLTAGFVNVCRGFNATTPSVGNININGGTMNTTGDTFLGFWGDGTATLNINSGAFNVGTTAERSFFMGYWDYVKGVINVNGGSFNFWNNSKVRMARNINNAGNTFGHVINQNAGNVTFYSDGGVTPGGGGLLDMHYDAAATNVTCTYNLNGGTLDVPAITSTVSVGGRIFNFNGGTLKSGAAGTLMDLGTGNAHAYVRTNGAVIDDNGNSVTIATALEHFSGDPTDGGLTKKGAGVLYLAGTNSYTGNTVVQAGTLQLAQAGLAATATVFVTNAAVLQLDFATTNNVAGLVTNGVALAPGVYNNVNAAPYITGTGTLQVAAPIASNPTNITFSASGGSLSLSWPADHLGWILQAQTNSRAIGISTNWFDVPGSASVSSTNVSINPADPTVFYRLRKP
jgi:autotransporter-associated beta strand protein